MNVDSKTAKKAVSLSQGGTGHALPEVLKQRNADNAHYASEVVRLLEEYGGMLPLKKWKNAGI